VPEIEINQREEEAPADADIYVQQNDEGLGGKSIFSQHPQVQQLLVMPSPDATDRSSCAKQRNWPLRLIHQGKSPAHHNRDRNYASSGLKHGRRSLNHFHRPQAELITAGSATRTFTRVSPPSRVEQTDRVMYSVCLRPYFQSPDIHRVLLLSACGLSSGLYVDGKSQKNFEFVSSSRLMPRLFPKVPRGDKC
jgi:hypothetical protein